MVLDRIGVGYGRGDILGGKAAPDGVATGIIFVCGEGGGGVILCWCLYVIILRIWLFVWLLLLWDIIGREGYGQLSIKAEPISAGAGRGEAIFAGFMLLYGSNIILINILCVGCVVTRLC